MPVNFSTVFDDDPLDILLRRRRQQEYDAQRSAAPKQPEMSDTEARSLLDTLGSGAATTLQYVGETLGKPGRAARGLLAGRPEELLNLIPGSDFFGWTDPAKSTSGDDLLDQYGIRSKDREKPTTFLGSVADALPGFATELATDPTVLFNVGPLAKTAAGIAKVKAGQPLAKGLLAQIGAGERSLLGASSLPILGRPIGLDALSGPGVETVVKGLGSAADAIGGFVPGYGLAKRGVAYGADKAASLGRQLFDASSRGFATPELQASGRALSDAERHFIADFVTGPDNAITSDLHAAGMLEPAVARKYSDAIRDLRWGNTPTNIDPAELPILQRAADALGQSSDEWYNAQSAAGVAGKYRQGYDPRQAVMPGAFRAGGARTEAFQPFSTTSLNALSMDPDVAGLATRFGTTFDALPIPEQTAAIRKAFTHLGQAAKPEEVEAAVRVMAQMPGDFAAQGGLFPNHVLEDFRQAGLGSARKVFDARAKTDALMQAASDAFAPGTQARPLREALSAARIDPDVIASQAGLNVGPGITDPLEGLAVPRALAKDAAYKELGAAGPLAAIFDAAAKYTNLWKGYATGFLPFTSGTALRNTTYNAFANYLQEGVNPAAEALARRAIAGDKSPEAVALADKFARWSLAPGMSNPDLYGSTVRAVDRVPGLEAATVRGKLASAVTGLTEPGGANPLNVKTFAPVKAGHAVNALNDEAARMALFQQRLSEGFEELPAMREVERVFGGPLSKFETNTVLPLTPFFRFNRSAIPYSLTELATRPGGASGVGARAAEYARRGDSRFLPDYLGTGLAAPVGKEDETGRQQYLTGLQLPFEQPFEILDKRGIGETLMHVLGQTNPLLKAGIETATNRQLYSGRELSDLQSPTGNRLLDEVIASSPLQRPAGVLSKLADPQNYADGGVGLALSLLTGAKVRPVDIAAARQKKAADVIKDELSGKKGVKPVDSIAVSAADLAQMDEADRRLYMLFQALQRKPK